MSARKETYIDGKFEVVLVFETVELLKKLTETLLLHLFHLALNISVSECCVYGSKDENLRHMKLWLLRPRLHKHAGPSDGSSREFDHSG